jgi:hypothetical protein
MGLDGGSPQHRRRRVLRYALELAAGVVALTVGLALLKHPIAGWAYGIPRRSDAAPVLGVGFLVVPMVLLLQGARRLWEAAVVAVEVRRQHQKPDH